MLAVRHTGRVSFAAHLVPIAFQRSKDYVDQKSNHAADQKRREQRKHLAKKTQNGIKVYQRPCEYNKPQQRTQQNGPDQAQYDNLKRQQAALSANHFF